MIQITDAIVLDDDEIEMTFVRAPGPGGQHVNKVETAVRLRFDARRSRNISTPVYKRLRLLAGQRMTQDGVIVIAAKQFRSQQRNRDDAMTRLADLIRRAAAPVKSRKPTKPCRAEKQRRLDTKHYRGRLKKQRGRVADPD